MKPPPFEYLAPRSAEEALAFLGLDPEETKLLAGGQSLVPLLNFRLTRPARLVDLNCIGELAYLHRRDGVLNIGAMTRQSTLERSRLVIDHWPILHRAIGSVAHPQIRNRGTVGGSAAHADPSAELPVVFTALDARFQLRSARGDRTVPATEFFRGPLTSALEPDEMLVEVQVPAMAAGARFGFVEFARRHGDFALAGAAVIIEQREDGVCDRAAVALLAAGPTPVRATLAEEALVGTQIDDAVATEAAACAVRDIRPTADLHGSTEYRRSLMAEMVRRALLDATRGGSDTP